MKYPLPPVNSFFLSNVASFLRFFDDILSGFRDKFQKGVTCVAFSIKLRKNQLEFRMPKFLKFVKIIQSLPTSFSDFSYVECVQMFSSRHDSILFIRVLSADVLVDVREDVLEAHLQGGFLWVDRTGFFEMRFFLPLKTPRKHFRLTKSAEILRSERCKRMY